jgi:hypothetical protein
MFTWFERRLASSRTQRMLVFVLLCLSALYFVSALLGPGLAILAGLAFVVVYRSRSKATPETAPKTILDVRHRPAPELVVGYDAFMRPVRNLLRHVPADQRVATVVALLEAMEVLADSSEFTVVERDDVRAAVRNRELPRLTKEADDLLAHGATLVRNVLSDTAQGRFLSVRLCLTDGTDITFFWNVRMLGDTCVYRIDQTQTPGR